MAAEIEIDEDLENAEVAQLEEDDHSETPPSDIVAFNELRSCADLHRLYVKGKLDIAPDFQRSIVWSSSNQTRFIDSLAKQLPIPSMCISFDYKTEKRQVVDGLQRMSSIIRFLSDDDWRLSNLEDIDSRLANKKVKDIKGKQSTLYARVEDTTIPVTVLRCDLSKRSHQEYLFTIFHRLNTTSVKLNNQEIRNCIFSGPYNKLLQTIVQKEKFKLLFDISPKRNYRMSYEELVLRIDALADDYTSYKQPLSKFLNAYMSEYRDAEDDILEEVNENFDRALTVIYENILKGEPFPRLSRATTEAIFVAVIVNIDACEGASNKDLRAAYRALRSDNLFSVESLKDGLSATQKVHDRILRAIEIFEL